MTEFEIIKEDIESIKRKYLDAAAEIISDYNSEVSIKNDYKCRQIYELLQNADDCYSRECESISVSMELRGNLLIVENNGTPFSYSGISSLLRTNTSSKYTGTIGCKGLGFRSVLNWAREVSVYTESFFVNFSEARAREQLAYYKKNSKYRDDELEKLEHIGRTAILTAAEAHDDREIIKQWLGEGYSTSIVLTCDEEYVEEIRNQLLSLKFEELIFLKHVNIIEIKTEGKTRKIESVKEKGLCTICDGDDISEWRVNSTEGEITSSDGEVKRYELTIAYNKDAKAREAIREKGYLYSYFKTDIQMGFPFLIHGTFELTSERNDLVKENEFNSRVIEKLIDFIGETGEHFFTDSGKCDYERLAFMLPSRPLIQLDSKYDFTRQLKESIKKYKVFPTVKGDYISIKEKPKYSKLRFDRIVKPETFEGLLLNTGEGYIADFIAECGIGFYTDKEMVDLINRDAQYYVDNNTNAELIATYYESFIRISPFSRIAPRLLTDSEGRLVESEEIRLFTTPTNAFELPEWSKMHFINPKLELTLSKRLGASNRSLVDRLSAFGVVEYSFDKVFSHLVSESRDDVERTRSMLAWLYEYWENNGRAFPSRVDDEARVVTRDGGIALISECHEGVEYGNILGERITSCIEGTRYVASPSEIGLGDRNIEDVKTFIRFLGARKYPKLELIRLTNERAREYISVNSRLFPTFYDIYHTKYDYSTFFSQGDREIHVLGINGISEVLEQADFYDIIAWILDEPRLYECIRNKNEIDERSRMKGKPARVKDFYNVRGEYMHSWLRRQFTESSWLLTQSKRRVSVGECTLSSHKLTGIVDVLDVDYSKLIRMTKRSKREIDLLFENLGIADDVADLAPEKIYEILLSLYENKAEYAVTKQIYTNLNIRYKSDDVDRLIENNPAYDKFKREGGVLAELNGEYKYLPLKDVYYVDKKIYSEDIMRLYPLLALKKRAGAPKIQKMFGVPPLQETSDISVEAVEHELSATYQREFRKLLPYLYAKRIAVDTKSKDLNLLRGVRIVLVDNATARYRIGEDIREGTLDDYELIYTDKVAYIKIPSHVASLNDLRESVKFRGAVAEVITTMLDVEGDKDAFMIILSCRSTREADEYFIENGDDTLDTVKLAKSKFSELIDREAEFWGVIANAKGDVRREDYEELMAGFDYENLNTPHNVPKIISLLRSLDLPVEEYNRYALDGIDLRPYYKERLREIKSSSREKYLIRFLSNSEGIRTRSEFDSEKQKYDEKVLDAPNSIYADLAKIYENSFGVSLDEIRAVEGSLADLIAKLADDTVKVEREVESTPPSVKTEVDYLALNAEIAASTTGETKSVTLSAFKGNTTRGGGKGRGTSYDTSTTRAKEEHGFIAESKVYHTLRALIADSGTVKWVSGNGFRAGENTVGNDSLGYDIWYSDSDSREHLVEVKGSTSDHVEFTLTKNELECAEKHIKEYEIWYVHIDGKKPSEPYRLGNLLDLGEEETFFRNNKFSVENSEFKIRAKVNEE